MNTIIKLLTVSDEDFPHNNLKSKRLSPPINDPFLKILSLLFGLAMSLGVENKQPERESSNHLKKIKSCIPYNLDRQIEECKISR
ncbi:hypothetical protein HQ39_03405 [Porphyromonas sp. COT-108 OH2963]|uniref:hypothetical protein n=1 Tax=Porphyromonas sp. COT-108 OH2963 TaxID=1515614 RepID=UPI00052B8B59|nr:hypothetical protein [Porphyromonas sp. COT-108 OH2963]KGN96019.1 hypothetical protein HQ39_03405 [Porphyromonas sp. COT-108 OH2963]